MDDRSIKILLSLMTFTTLLNGAMSQVVNCSNPADVMFLLDGSDSIDQREWDQARNFVARMIGALDISPSTINVGITVYSSSIAGHHSVYPFKHKIVLTGMARSLTQPTGIATNTALGIMKVRQTFREQPFSRRGAPKILIVITDGSSENPAETINQAKQAKAEGIRIISVGVGNNVFVEELQQIASNSRKYYQTVGFSALRAIESDIRNMICRVSTTTKAPSFTFAPPTLPQEIPVTGDRICNVPADIVFVIDGSDSISDADFIRLKNFVASLIGNFEIGPDAIHVGMLVYSTLIGDTIGLFPSKPKLILQALARNLKHPRFGTDTALGIESARDMIREQGRPNAPEIIVVITDGRSSNPRNTIIQANLARASGITTIAIGVGTAIFSEELTQIASGPNYVSEVADFRALENTVNLMRNLICTSITTTTTTTTALPPTMPPYIEPPAEGLICNVPGDVVFLLDGSDSIAPNDWTRQRNFVANLINNLEVGPQYIHVSVIVYSSQIGQEVELQPFKPKPILNGLVKNLNQPRFGTDTALGIQRARELLKLQGRANAPKVIIVVTDGKSTYPDNTLLQANMAKADGITMISVGVGSNVFPDELKNIATSERKSFQVIDFGALKNIIGTLRDLICRLVQTTTVAPITTTTPPPTTTQMMTPAPIPLYPCGESYTAADLVFLMDGTKSLTPYNWMMSTHFMSNMLDGLELTNQYMHVGVVISDTIRGDSIGITPFKTRYHLKQLMHGLLQPGGSMDTATGIRKVTNIFNRQGRPGAQKIMVVLTDGTSKSVMDTSQAADRLKALGADVVAVGVGNNINLRELQSIASNPNFVLQTNDYNQIQGLLPRLQNVVCDILRKPTTPAPTPAPFPSLCEGCLIEAGIGFNPYPGDCTKFVQCWMEGETVKYLIRSCPFGQFWDADAITCRPSFLVRCTADPCKQAILGFTYGMIEYGCRAYWKCIDGFSVGHCCPRGSAYVEGLGCLERPGCNQECPPSGGIAMQAVCDKKKHWDKRYYIEIVYGRGEIVRPCPAGTIFFPDKCTCDYGMSALLPASHVMCKPAAFFPFDMNLKDQSLNNINVGITNVQRTDLGTAFFDGRSEMNLWRFAGTDWGPTLVIKFKFRFDYSNKVIDYGGLPVDLGVNFDMTMNLISDFQMTDADWRLWNKLNNVRTLADWQQLLKEFGQSRTFYIFLGALGFKPGTFNSLQVVRILSTPEAFNEFKALLSKLQQQMSSTVDFAAKPVDGLKSVLTKLRNYHGLVNWDRIITGLTGEGHTNTTTGGAGAQTTVAGGGQWVPQDKSNWRFDAQTNQWIRIGSTGGGATGGMTGSGGSNAGGIVINGFGTGGFGTGTGSGGSGSGSATGSGGFGTGSMSGSGSFSTGSVSGSFGTGSMGGSGAGNMAGSGGLNTGGMTGSMGGFGTGTMTGSGGFGTGGLGTGGLGTGGLGTGSMSGGVTNVNFTMGTMGGNFDANILDMGGVNAASEWRLNPTTGQWERLAAIDGGGGVSGGDVMITNKQWGGNTGGNAGGWSTQQTTGGQSGSWSFEAGGSRSGTVVSGGVAGGAAGNMGGASMGGASMGGASMGGSTIGGASMGGASMVGSTMGGASMGGASMGGSSMGGSSMGGASMGGSTMGGASMGGSSMGGASLGGASNIGVTSNMHGVGDAVTWEDLVRRIRIQLRNGSASTGGTGGMEENKAAILALLKQIQDTRGQGQGVNQNGQVSWQWSKSGGTATGNQLDTKKLDVILKQIEEAAMAKARSSGAGSGSVNIGSGPASSKWTVQEKIDTSQPINNEITGGRVVGGAFSQFGQSSSGGNTGAMGGGQGQTSGGASFTITSSGTQSSGGSSGGQFGLGGGQGGAASGQFSFGSASGQSGQGSAGGQMGQGSAGQGMFASQGSFNGQSGQGSNIGQMGQGSASQGMFASQGSFNGQFGQGGLGGQGDVKGATLIKQTIQGTSKPAVQDRSALRGANAKGFKATRAEGDIIGLRIPNQGDFISGATVIGKGERAVRVTQNGPQIRITDIVQEVNPFTMEGSMAGGTSGFSTSGGASGSWSASGAQQSGGASGSNQFVGRETVAQGGGRVAQGEFTHLGSVGGSGGGVKRIIDTHVKRIPGGSATFDAQGGVDLASLGLGGADGANIVRQTVKLDPSSSGGQFIDASTLNRGKSSDQLFGTGTQSMRNVMGLGAQSNQGFYPFLTPDGVDTLLDGFSGKRRKRRSTRSSRNKRAVNKQSYQALVTNCQGQNGQGPSIMVVANQGDVQFALKTYGAKEPGIVSVPAVDGWNDVTLIYDGKTLTGVVENWKGFFKSSVNLSGNIERRQAGLLVGSCQGYASFHGEIDDLTVYKCLTPDIIKLRDQRVV